MHMLARTNRWTLAQLNRLPDDGNKYEVVRGELFVTPAPTHDHETVVAILHSRLEPYVVANALGRIYRPRAVVRVTPHSEVEPDLMVRPLTGARSWEAAPVPILVVEITSDSTRRRDHVQKRQLYLDIGVQEYWVVDMDERSVRVIRPGVDDVVVSDAVRWHPVGAQTPLQISVPELFAEVPAAD